VTPRFTSIVAPHDGHVIGKLSVEPCAWQAVQ
jgi:hypothetical protein